MDKKEIVQLLNDFRNKGCAWQTQDKAKSILGKLKRALPDSEFQMLRTAHSHYLLGEGAEECYHVIREIKAKYQP